MIGIITVIIKAGIHLAGPNPIPTATDTGVTLDPITSPPTAAHHATEAQAYIITDIPLHPTQQILIMQKFLQRQQ